jgi:hypothetical protein
LRTDCIFCPKFGSRIAAFPASDGISTFERGRIVVPSFGRSFHQFAPARYARCSAIGRAGKERAGRQQENRDGYLKLAGDWDRLTDEIDKVKACAEEDIAMLIRSMQGVGGLSFGVG